jgi:hypothetical protein
LGDSKAMVLIALRGLWWPLRKSWWLLGHSYVCP